MKIVKFLPRNGCFVRRVTVLKKQDPLSKACLNIWRPVATSLCREVQHSNVLWWLHPFADNLQTKFHICPRTQMPTPCLMTFVSWTSLDMGNYCVSILWSLDHTYISSFIHCYKTVQKFHRILPKSVWSGLGNNHSITFLVSIETFGNSFGWELSHV